MLLSAPTETRGLKILRCANVRNNFYQFCQSNKFAFANRQLILKHCSQTALFSLAIRTYGTIFAPTTEDMKRFSINVVWLAIFVLTSLFIGSVVDTRIAELIGTSVTSRSLPPSRISDSRTQVPILAAFNQLPMSFEPNRGQTDERVKFLSRTTGYTLFLTDSEAVLLLETQADRSRNLSREPAAIHLKFVGNNPAANVIGFDPLPGKSNYLVGNDSSNWQTEVPHYRRVRYENIYPGVDLIFYGNRQHLEFDFVVAPGVDPNVIQMAIEGTERANIDLADTLILHTRSEEVLLRTPIVYQIENGLRKQVKGHYEARGKNVIGFAVSATI